MQIWLSRPKILESAISRDTLRWVQSRLSSMNSLSQAPWCPSNTKPRRSSWHSADPPNIRSQRTSEIAGLWVVGLWWLQRTLGEVLGRLDPVYQGMRCPLIANLLMKIESSVERSVGSGLQVFHGWNDQGVCWRRECHFWKDSWPGGNRWDFVWETRWE